MQCRSCGFIGDLIRLHASVKKESLDATIADLTAKGLLDLEGSEVTYIHNAEVQQVLQKLISRKEVELKESTPSSFQGMMCTLNCRLLSQIPPQLRRHIVPLRKEDISDLDIPISDDADSVFRWWGRLGAVGVPAYDGPDITGFWILTQRGEQFLPIINRKTTAAFACVPSMSDPAVFVVDDIAEAVRLTIWSAVHREKPIGFVVPVGIRDTTEQYAAKQVIFWSAKDDSAWILRSRHCAQNLVLLNSSVTRTGVYPFDGDFPKFMHEVETLAMPAYAGIAKHLLSLNRRQAMKVVAVEPMEPAERAKIAANASGEDARLLQQMFSAQAPAVVDWCGITVSETPNGWVCRGRVISSAVFYLDEVRPFGQGGDAIVTGSVIYNRKAVAFSEKLSLIRKNTAVWLENFAVQKFGVIVHIEKQWRGRLLELSQQFRCPNPIMPEQRYGWNGHSLRMPFFIVDHKDLSPSYEFVNGPRVPVPSPFTEAEKDAFNSEGFCRLFLAMLKNMIQTADGVGSGWLLVNQPHVVERVAHAFSLVTQRDPTDAIIQSQRCDPIIRPTILDQSIARILSQGPSANLLVSLDRLTASLAYIFHGWPTLTVDQEVEYRCLRGVFFVLQSLLARPKTVWTYRGLSEATSQHFGIKGALYAAGLELDRAKIVSEQSIAVKLCYFLAALHKADELPVKTTDKGCHIQHADFYALVAGSPIDVPDAKALSHEFATAKFLVGNTETEWIFEQGAWSFHQGWVPKPVQ